MTDLTAANKAMGKVKIALMSSPDSAFFTTVAFSMKHSFDDSIPTACTNGHWIKYNPEFFMKQSPAQRLGLMLHETFHVIFMHMLRLQGRDMTKWNFATDYVINLMLTDRGFELPAGALLDNQWRDMSAEEVYDKLPDPPPDPAGTHFVLSEGDPSSGGGPGAPIQPGAATEQHIQDVLVRARIQSQMAGDKPGTIPGDIEFYLDSLLNPKLPTSVLLRKYVNALAKNDYSWRRPNRRHFPKHYLPSAYSEVLDHVAVAVDASASVSDEEFLRFVSEAAGIFRSVRPKKISVVTFDTKVQQVDVVRNTAELSRIAFHGRGGTSIEPVLDWANANKPKVMMVFSDGYFRFPDWADQTKVPTIWCIHDNETFESPTGRVVHYSLD